MEDNIKRIINEEVDRYVSTMRLDSPKEIHNVINELFYMSTDKLMQNIGSVEADGNNEIAVENWDLFVENLTTSISEENEIWRLGIKNVKLKILTYKYFTRKDMIDKDSLESYLRMEIKPYFTALQNYVDSKDFIMKFFQLPSSVLYAMVRYLFVISPELNRSISVVNDELKDNINRVMQSRMEVAEKIGKISNGYANLFDVKEVKDLYDNGVLFEDNFLNRGINEFVAKMTVHEEARNAMIDVFSGSMVTDINKQAQESSAYISHVTAIRNETGYEYFTVNGQQIGKKFDNEIDLVKNRKYDGYVVDGKSRLKEPTNKIKDGKMPWEENTGGLGPEGDAGGGPAGQGGGDASQDGFSGDFGNAGFSGDFAEPGAEGEVPGADDVDPDTVDDDGEPMPAGDDGMPQDFGTEEDNGAEEEEDGQEEPAEEKK